MYLYLTSSVRLPRQLGAAGNILRTGPETTFQNTDPRSEEKGLSEHQGSWGGGERGIP